MDIIFQTPPHPTPRLSKIYGYLIIRLYFLRFEAKI